MTQPLTLREARERLDQPLTQAQLAEVANVDQTYISLIERGLRTPSDDIKRRLAEALGIAPSELRFGQPQPDAIVDPLSDSGGHTEDRRAGADRRTGTDRRAAEHADEVTPQ